jgi:hypothetical protein
MEKFTNGEDRDDIVPDADGTVMDQEQDESFTLSDIATDEDDVVITGDNVLSRVEVRKPHQQEWFRVHPTWKLTTRAVIDKRGAQETCYLLHKRLMPWSESLEQDSVPVLVRVCINRKGKIFLWVIRRGRDDDKLSKFYSIALEHVQAAITSWVRRFWVEEDGRHHKRTSKVESQPEWPAGVTFEQIIVAGFGPRIIRDENAPILRELRGEDSDA